MNAHTYEIRHADGAIDFHPCYCNLTEGHIDLAGAALTDPWELAESDLLPETESQFSESESADLSFYGIAAAGIAVFALSILMVIL